MSMQLSEIEYKGLNLNEEICTVEIALDEGLNVIHVFDVNYVVEPVYDFANKKYELNEGFYLLAEVLKPKYFFVEKREKEIAEWIASFTWQFYGSNQVIKSYREGIFSLTLVHTLSTETEEAVIQRGLYPKYVERLR